MNLIRLFEIGAFLAERVSHSHTLDRRERCSKREPSGAKQSRVRPRLRAHTCTGIAKNGASCCLAQSLESFALAHTLENRAPRVSCLAWICNFIATAAAAARLQLHYKATYRLQSAAAASTSTRAGEREQPECTIDSTVLIVKWSSAQLGSGGERFAQTTIA